MTNDRIIRMRRPVLVACTMAVAAALLVGCGGGGAGAVTPGQTAMQSESEQAALKRAIDLNKSALAARVKGERSSQ